MVIGQGLLHVVFNSFVVRISSGARRSSTARAVERGEAGRRIDFGCVCLHVHKGKQTCSFLDFTRPFYIFPPHFKFDAVLHFTILIQQTC